MHKHFTPILLAVAALALSGNAVAQISGSFGADTPAPSAAPEDAAPGHFVVDPKEAFGLDAQGVSWIDGSDFYPTAGSNSAIAPLVHLGNNYFGSSSGGDYSSPIKAPVGVGINGVDCYYKIKNQTSQLMTASWMISESGDSQNNEGTWHIASDTVSSFPTSYPGYGILSLRGSNDSYTMTYKVGDRRQTYLIQISIPKDYALFGCEVRWRRLTGFTQPWLQSFNDVPPSSNYFQAVEALAASGITSGCGGGKFCPDEVVTRKQMAVFLTKALGLHRPEE